MGTVFDNKCQIKDLQITLDGKHILLLTVPASIKQAYDDLKDKDLRIELKQWREKRSLDANAYFHVLVGKIAQTMNLPFDETKRNLVISYGCVAKDSDGNNVGIKLLPSVDPVIVNEYLRYIETRIEKGIEFNVYLMYLPTHLMDSEQFSKVLTGTIQEAQCLGIETITPAEKAKMLSLWGEK